MARKVTECPHTDRKHFAKGKCSSCYCRGQQVKRPDHKKRAKRYALKCDYGMTLEEYEALFLKQDGKCVLCHKGQTKRLLSVDHDHKTGKIRGLVCVRCNVLLGMAQDQPERFTAAITYLAKHS